MRLDQATVLVVDDEPFLRDCYYRWLQRRGCSHVFTAGNGIEALALIETEKFDAMVTDIHMPLMDGIQLIRAIRERGFTIPSIIFVSGYLEVDRAEMFELGVECILGKPFGAKLLLDQVEISLADRSDLWQTPLPDRPVQEVWIERVTPGPHAAAGSICFGRGGFCAWLPNPVGEGPVNFVITLDSEPQELRGQGYMRWYSAETRIGTVEFEYLDPDSRVRLLELVGSHVYGEHVTSV